jgi:hypothetical protein
MVIPILSSVHDASSQCNDQSIKHTQQDQQALEGKPIDEMTMENGATPARGGGPLCFWVADTGEDARLPAVRNLLKSQKKEKFESC